MTTVEWIGVIGAGLVMIIVGYGIGYIKGYNDRNSLVDNMQIDLRNQREKLSAFKARDKLVAADLAAFIHTASDMLEYYEDQ